MEKVCTKRNERVWIEEGKTTSKNRDRKPRTNQGDPHRSWPRRALPQQIHVLQAQ